MVDIKKQKKKKENNLAKKIVRVLLNAYELKLPDMKKEDILNELGYSKERSGDKKFKSQKSSVGTRLIRNSGWITKTGRGYYKLDIYQYRHWQRVLRGKSVNRLCSHLTKRKNGKYYCEVTSHVMGSPKDMCTEGYCTVEEDGEFKKDTYLVCAGYCSKESTNSNKSVSMNRIWRDECWDISAGLVPRSSIDYDLMTTTFNPEVPIKGEFI